MLNFWKLWRTRQSCMLKCCVLRVLYIYIFTTISDGKKTKMITLIERMHANAVISGSSKYTYLIISECHSNVDRLLTTDSRRQGHRWVLSRRGGRPVWSRSVQHDFRGARRQSGHCRPSDSREHAYSSSIRLHRSWRTSFGQQGGCWRDVTAHWTSPAVQARTR
jgi:hypothetical protein